MASRLTALAQSRRRRGAWRCAPGLVTAGALLLLLASAGCGTTKWSDTPRTATEQLLISDAVDQAISEINFSALADRTVFFDSTYLKGSVDENYVTSTLRQHLLASGCLLMEKREEADYVVEARAGAVGTDRSDLLFGVPSVNVPAVPGMPMAMPSAIPEIPFAKTTNQKAVAKLAVFAYNRKTGRPVLQSGVDPVVSTARNSWLLGAGPFRRGTIYEHHQRLENGVEIPIIGGRDKAGELAGNILPVTAEAVFSEPPPEQIAVEEASPLGPPSPEPMPTVAGNQMARLPAVDHSRLNPGSNPPPHSPPQGAPPVNSDPNVRRAQWSEPAGPAGAAAPPPLPLSSTGRGEAATGRGETGSTQKSSWNRLWPGNWFGGK